MVVRVEILRAIGKWHLHGMCAWMGTVIFPFVSRILRECSTA